MIRIRKAAERGHFDHGWLDTYHTFSFSRYFDPRQMGFRALRVINEDRVSPGKGFGLHPHENMEIVTYVLEGGLAHRDSLGTGSVIRPGELQRMTAGTGITHSEANPSATEPVHLYQIWLLPEREGLEPSYEQKAFPVAERTQPAAAGRIARRGRRVADHPAGRPCSPRHAGTRSGGVPHLREGRHAWLQVLRGDVDLNGRTLGAGDGAAVSEESGLAIRDGSPPGPK